MLPFLMIANIVDSFFESERKYVDNHSSMKQWASTRCRRNDDVMKFGKMTVLSMAALKMSRRWNGSVVDGGHHMRGGMLLVYGSWYDGREAGRILAIRHVWAPRECGGSENGKNDNKRNENVNGAA